MSKIYVGAEYYGGVIKSTHQKDNVSGVQMAHLFGCDMHQLHRYEEGLDLIPRDVLRRVFRYATMMDKAIENK